MSTMLEQAIVDAKALREAAVKSAEAAIVEKYNDEVKDAVSKLLEQDDEMDLGMEPEAEVEVDSTAMEQVPMAHLSDDDEDIVVVDLDDIIAAAESEEGADLIKSDVIRAQTLMRVLMLTLILVVVNQTLPL